MYETMLIPINDNWEDDQTGQYAAAPMKSNELNVSGVRRRRIQTISAGYPDVTANVRLKAYITLTAVAP